MFKGMEYLYADHHKMNGDLTYRTCIPVRGVITLGSPCEIALIDNPDCRFNIINKGDNMGHILRTPSGGFSLDGSLVKFYRYFEKKHVGKFSYIGMNSACFNNPKPEVKKGFCSADG